MFARYSLGLIEDYRSVGRIGIVPDSENKTTMMSSWEGFRTDPTLLRCGTDFINSAAGHTHPKTQRECITSLGEGKLQGVCVEEDDTVQSGINSDNNVNKAVYGIKAREVLAGIAPLRAEVPEPITEFHKLLTSLLK